MYEHLDFFKNKIKSKLLELKPNMSDIKYRLYLSMIDECESFEEIRDIAELDLQFDLIKYIKDIDSKLKLSDTDISELEAVANRNSRAAKLAIIKPNNESEAQSKINSIDFSDILSDLDDDELLDTISEISESRVENAPVNETDEYYEALELYNQIMEDFWMHHFCLIFMEKII